MNARAEALVVDFTLAGGAVVVGTLGLGGSVGWSLALAAGGCGLLVGVLYLAEQTPLLGLVEEHSPASLVVAFVLTLAVAAALVAGRTVLTSPAATLLFGMGIGLGAYRTMYGLVHPVPEKRLQETAAAADEYGLDDPP